MRLSLFERVVIRRLQRGFPLSEQPYAEVAAELHCSEDRLLDCLRRLLLRGVLTRFGPMFAADVLGGGLTLAAMCVPEADCGRVAGLLDGLPEVAHNYLRDHRYNLWFVLATEHQAQIAPLLRHIERISGYEVLDLPKVRTFHLDLYLEV
ncbi:AsnC family transcriptional regulator [Pseudomonas sp. ATCC 13867]|uniref:hypothetical protein n=1 Tax=Pseudomonas sp. ATCC 13867 TaxID=1294143 RepID=UPI0002C4E9A7|nr:hypothetical protein [Pseudomonas sp. ATCC 13867]AGI25711.1 AsnC family transcriptional regulator [Pseudomonas sp. ATCC 13867]